MEDLRRHAQKNQLNLAEIATKNGFVRMGNGCVSERKSINFLTITLNCYGLFCF